MTVFALVQKLSGTEAIYWLHKPRFGGAIFGPFTNRNHFAAHINMALGVALGLLLTVARAPDEEALPTWRRRLSWLLSNRGSRIALLGSAALLMAAAVFVTLSRGGILALVASAALVVMVLVVCQGGLVGAMLVLGGIWLFARSVLSRLRRAAPGPRLFAIGLAVGLAAIAMHSALDYSLHRPANALLLAAVCAMALAAVHLPTVSRVRPWGIAVRSLAVVCLCLLAALVLLSMGVSHGRAVLFLYLASVSLCGAAMLMTIERAASAPTGGSTRPSALRRSRDSRSRVSGSSSSACAGRL